MKRIYLDNNATTVLDPRVLKAMLVDLEGPPANPSSIHFFGRKAKEHLLKARNSVAQFFQVKPEEIIFTSGGTESINLFLRGLKKKGHIITTAIEHSCIYKTVQQLEHEGFDVTYVSTGLFGAPTPKEIKAAIRPDTCAIALSGANSETGVKLDLEEVAFIAYERKIPLLIDAVAYIGKEALPHHPGITAIALSAHKFHGPKGIGALVLRSSCKLFPSITGGGQEHRLRAGTENLAGILGLAEAIHILSEEQPTITQHLLNLRLRLEQGLKQEIPDLQIHGEAPRICNTANLAFPGIDGETLLIQLDIAGIAVSHGSACSSGALEPSRVLTNMGVPPKLARSSLRFSLSRFNTREEIDHTIKILSTLVKKIEL